MRAVRATAIATIGLLAALVPAQAALAANSRPAVPRTAGVASFHLPYTDPEQKGWLTLCGANLKPVTSGSIHTIPFVSRVVSSAPTPAGYFIKGAKAQMFAYQPRPYTPAGAWSGTVMGAASLYSNRKHPMAAFTPDDLPLTQMTLSFPPIWDHLIELRLYLGAPGRAELTTGYAAADIQVTGNTWRLVAGGHTPCTAGKVESIETLDHMPGANRKPKTGSSSPSSSSKPGSSAGSSSPGSKSGSSGGGSNSGGSGPNADGPAATSSSSVGSVALITVAVVAVALAVIFSTGAWRRKRRRATG